MANNKWKKKSLTEWSLEIAKIQIVSRFIVESYKLAKHGRIALKKLEA